MHIVSASWDKTACIWNTATGECEAELKGHSANVHSAAFSPDGLHIMSASWDRTAHVWNTATGESEAVLAHSNFKQCQLCQRVYISAKSTWLSSTYLYLIAVNYLCHH